MAGSLTCLGITCRSVSGAPQSACPKAGHPLPAIPPDALWLQLSLPPELRGGNDWEKAGLGSAVTRPSQRAEVDVEGGRRQNGDKACNSANRCSQVLLLALRSPQPRANAGPTRSKVVVTARCARLQ